MATTTDRKEANAFRITAYVEALSYLVLLTFVVVYRVFDGPDLIRVPGMVHGIVVLVYFVMVLRIRESQGWSVGETLLILLASALPFGGFWAGRHLK
jgi:integral membrane protein